MDKKGKFNKDLVNDIKGTIVREDDVEYVMGNLDKLSDYKVNKHRGYITYAREFISEYSNPDIIIDDEQTALEYMLNLFTDENKRLFLNGAIYKKDLEKADKKGSHNKDGRNTLDFWMNIQVGDIMERLVIAEGKFLGHDIRHNPNASHASLEWQGYEPDLIIRLGDKTVELEQQLSNWKYQKISCKKEKLNKLREFSGEDRDIYIFQQAIVDGKSHYAFINVEDEFIDTGKVIEEGSNKEIYETKKKVIYRDFDKTIQALEQDVKSRHITIIDKLMETLKIEELKNKERLAQKGESVLGKRSRELIEKRNSVLDSLVADAETKYEVKTVDKVDCNVKSKDKGVYLYDH